MTPKELFINDAIAGWGGLSLPDKVRVLYEYKLKEFRLSKIAIGRTNGGTWPKMVGICGSRLIF